MTSDPGVQDGTEDIQSRDVRQRDGPRDLSVKRSQMTRMYSYPSGVRGNGPSRSIARAAKDSVAGNNRMGAVLCVPSRRFFAQVGHAATQPKTSAANDGQ